MAREMLEPGKNQWGLGIETGGSREHRYFTHGGANEGFQCDLVAYNNGDGAIIMTNSDSGGQLATEWPTMRPRRRCAAFSKSTAPAARENSGEGGIPVKAVRTHGRGGPEHLFFEDAPVPVVRPGDVLVRVRATGITPAELTWDETYQNADGTPRIPGIPGHEPSGVVEKTAPDVTDFRAGDEIYGLADFPRDGAAAEFAAVRAANLALKPRSIPDVQAAALPLSALTAWQALFEHARLGVGQAVGSPGTELEFAL